MIPLALFFAFFCEYLRPPKPSAWLYAWHSQFLRWTVATFDANQSIHGKSVWIIAVGLPAIATVAIYWILAAIASPLAWFFSVLVLYSTLALQPFVAYIQALHQASEHDDIHTAAPNPSLPQEMLLTPSSNPLDAAVQYVHQHILGLSLAYILLAICGLGPAGAVLYYGAALAVRHTRMGLDIKQGQSAHTVWAAWRWINWLPARAVALSFAAVGNFEHALHNWRAHHASQRQRVDYCISLLQTVAHGAINTHANTTATEATPPQPTPPPTHSTYDPTWFEDTSPALLRFKHHINTVAAPDIQAQHQELGLLVRLIWRTLFLWAVVIGFISITHWLS